MSEYFLVHTSLQIRQVERKCLGDSTFKKEAEPPYDDNWQRSQARSYQNRRFGRSQIGDAEVKKCVEHERKRHHDQYEVATPPTGYDDPWERHREKYDQ